MSEIRKYFKDSKEQQISSIAAINEKLNNVQEDMGSVNERLAEVVSDNEASAEGLLELGEMVAELYENLMNSEEA